MSSLIRDNPVFVASPLSGLGCHEIFEIANSKWGIVYFSKEYSIKSKEKAEK